LMLYHKPSLPRRRETRRFEKHWIPAFAGMTNPQHAAGSETRGDSKPDVECLMIVDECSMPLYLPH